MQREIRIDPADPLPIWKQIEEGIRRLVASAALKPGDVVPSVRDLARDLCVNPATVAKAYQRLVDEGLLEVRRGEGTFVAAKLPIVGKADRNRELKQGAIRYASQAVTLGAGEDEALQHVRGAFTVLGKTDTGGPK